MTGDEIRRTDRILSAVAAVCALALFLPLTRPLLTGRVFVFDDLQNFHLPVRYVYAKALAAGYLPLWTPTLYGGVYLHGEGQVGMLHPLHLVLYRCFPLGAAFNLEFLVNYAMAFAGTAWLLRRLRLPMASALFGALLFAFSGFQLLHHHHLNLVAVTAHLPWLLASIDLLITGDRPAERAAGYAGVALVTASELLVGFPQGVWWSVLAAAPFAAFRASETARWRRLAPCAAAAITGALLGAVQLVPTLDAAAHSVRAGGNRTFALTYSLSPWNIVQLWSPYFFEKRAASPVDFPHVHEFGIYSGALLTLAPIWLAIRFSALADRRRLVAACALFAAVAFVLTLGSYGGLDVLLTYVPGLGSFRAPARYIVLVQFALAIMAAVAFDDLVRAWPRGARLTRAQTMALGSVAGASVLVTLAWNTRVLPAPGWLPIAPVMSAIPGVAFVAAVTLVFALTVRHVSWAPAALVILTAADLGFWGLRYVYREPPREIRDLTSSLTQLAGPGMRVWVEGDWGDRPLLKDYEIVPGYLGLYPATVRDGKSDAFRILSGARWTLTKEGAVIPYPDARPRVWLEDAQFAMLDGARVAIDNPGHIVVKTTAHVPTVLAVAERFDNGWRVSVDGTDTAAVRVGSDFLGVSVPAGSHRVEFLFAPRSFAIGQALSALGGLLLIGVIMVSIRAGSRRDRDPAR